MDFNSFPLRGVNRVSAAASHNSQDSLGVSCYG